MIIQPITIIIFTCFQFFFFLILNINLQRQRSKPVSLSSSQSRRVTFNISVPRSLQWDTQLNQASIENKRGFGRDQLKALTFAHKLIFRVAGTGDGSD